jgi:glycosyltransferase involved in cell wall biosynthesis
MLGPWVPSSRYPVDGERLLHFARHFAARHQLVLAFATDVEDPTGTISALRTEFPDMEFALVPRAFQRLWSAFRLIAGASVDLSYFDSDALRARLQARSSAKPFDLVYAASAGMIQYALELEPATPLIVDFGELDSEWWKARSRVSRGAWAALYRREAAKVRALERAAARRAAISLVSSAKAAERVAALAPGAAVAVITNGIDPDRHSGASHRSPEPAIAFTGCLEPPHGLMTATEFCRVVLPAVRAQVSGARLLIPGKYLPSAARSLSRLPGVTILANGGDYRSFLRHAAVAVAPTGDSNGARQSTLEAMAAGIPVVVNRNWFGDLEGRPGPEIFVEDDPRAFAGRLVQLLTSETLRLEAGRRGRDHVRAYYSWEVSAARLAEVLERRLGIRRDSPPPEPALDVRVNP